MRVYSFIFVFLFSFNILVAQDPVADFNLSQEVCLEQNMIINNLSISAVSYLWDFCHEDLKATATVQIHDTIDAGSQMNSITLVNESGKWYGFVSNRGNSKLLRLDFGSSLDNTPTIVDLGTLSGALSGPRNLALRKEGTNWYGLITNINNNTIRRLNFGSSLENVPTTENLGNFGVLNQPYGLDLIEEPGQLTAVIPNFGANTVLLVDFGSSITSTPTVTDALSVGSSADGLNRPLGVSVQKSSGTWFAVVSNYQDGKVFRLTFGPVIKSTPTITQIGGVTGNGAEVKIIKEGAEYYAFVLGMTSGLYRFSFGDNLANAPQSNSLGTLGVLTSVRSLDIAYTGQSYRGFVGYFSTTDKTLYKLNFNGDCSSKISLNSSTDIEPETVSYFEPGDYYVNLTAYDGGGKFDTTVHVVNVLNKSAPFLSFVTNNICIDNVNIFSATSSDDKSVSSWNWDFGDGTNDSGQIMSHQYSFTGSYLVKLDIETTEGCTNQISDTLRLYPIPIADFSLPTENLCTNAELNFVNQSNHVLLDDSEFKWDFNREGTTGEVDGSFTFESSGIKEITLIASLTGCADTLIQQLNIAVGPVMDFIWTNNCFGDSVAFINYSETLDISFTWDFGDGLETSSLFNPKHLYDSGGDYMVKLEGLSLINGCKTVIDKEIKINENSLASIDYDQPVVENIFTQFHGEDLTLIGDSLISWEWVFPTDTFLVKNPSVTFPSPDTIIAVLNIKTEQGCSASLKDTIIVNEAQFPSTSFTASPACINENISLDNQTINGVSFFWDFCHEDLKATPDVQVHGTVEAASLISSITLVEENSKWYGFISNMDSHKLLRLDFGASLDNWPIIVDMGNLDGALNGPRRLKLRKEGNNWYGLITNINSNSICRLAFGSSLENVPTTQNLGTFGVLNQPYGLDIIEEPGQLTAVVTNFGANNLFLLDFGNSIANTPSGLIVGSSVEGLNRPMGIGVVQSGEQWFGILSNYQDGKIFKLFFNATIKSAPTMVQIGSISGNGTGVKIVSEDSLIYAFILGSNSGLHKYSFGNSLLNQPQFEILGTFGLLTDTRSIDIGYNGEKYIGFMGEFSKTNKNLYKISFSGDCSEFVSINTSASISPQNVNFSKTGSYKINLKAFSANGNYTSYADIISISDLLAPSTSFISANTCLSRQNLFTATINDTSTITNYTWYIDELDTLSGNEVSFHFPEADTFNVALSVQAANGCFQRILKQVPIYKEPIPSFTFPEGTLCSNSAIPFANTSEMGGAEDVIQWQWDFNEEGVSDQKDTEFNFSQGGAKMVSLTAAIPGCAPKTTKWFNVTTGPEVQFSVQNQCFGEELQFVNKSSGEGITQYHWLLGNGQTSFEAAPSLLYDTAGTYPVQLEVTNEMGCTNALEKDILVHFNPVADMEYGLLCSSGTHFIDKSTVTRANLTKWEWSILQDGQYQLLSNQKNPMIETGTAGIHRLKLYVASNFGCSDSKEVEIDALPGPEADFATSAICVGDSVLFTDLSVSLQNNPVTQWYWNINGKGFFTQQPKSLFQTPGAYQVSLKVDAQNLCSDMITKTVVVPRLPVPVFTTSKLCQNEHILFADKSFSPDDPVKSWEWDFAGLATKTGPQAQFQFPTAKDHAVKLSVVTENGCRQFMVNTVSINPAPKAKFSLYPAVGTVPLPVTLENQSIGAVNYRWTFGEHADSVVTDFQPDYTYQSLGEHEIKLLAISDKGCRDSVSQMISIRLPLLDVELERILKVVNNGELQLVTRINNLGSLIIQDMDLVIDLGSIKLRESFPEILEAGEGVNHPLNFRISDFIAQGLEYVCITLEPRMPGNQEVSLENNKMCISLNELFSILEPFPNPVNTELNISYIATNTSDGVSMLVADLTGRVVLDKKVQPQQTGMNHHLLDVRGLSGGMYVIKIAVNDKVIIRRVLVER